MHVLLGGLLLLSEMIAHVTPHLARAGVLVRHRKVLLRVLLLVDVLIRVLLLLIKAPHRGSLLLAVAHHMVVHDLLADLGRLPVVYMRARRRRDAVQ